MPYSARRFAACTAMPPSPLAAFTALDAKDGSPLYRQLYERVREAIAVALLAPGDRVPSARALALELGVARGTVEQAYGLLAAEGYLLAQGQAGTVVHPALAPPRAASPAPPLPTLQPDAAAAWWRPPQLLPFQMGVPAFDAFPRKLWARLGARHLRGLQTSDLDYPAPYGLPALRSAIAAYLQLARGIDCAAHQVFVTTGWRSSLQLAALALLKPGESVWVEDPGYPPTRDLLSALGMRAVPVPVDAQGLNVAEGQVRSAGARMAVVTPAHHSPLSVTLSLPRRHALLDWAQAQSAWVVEDDYDGEYRYASRPLPALASLDRQERVLYGGTFSKVLFPGIRLAYLVVPRTQVALFEKVAKIFLAATAPVTTQAMVASFMAEGHFTRHIQRMRRLYAERRAATIAALKAELGTRAQIADQPGGMHLILRLPGARTDQPLVQKLRAQGLSVQALSHWSASGDTTSALLLSFTNCTSDEPVRQLAAAWR